MAMGMSYDEFWHGDFTRWKYYEETYLLKRKQQNEMLWLQGAYVYDAFNAVLANAFAKKGAAPVKYREEPIRITPMTEEEKEAEKQKTIEKFRASLNMAIERFNKKQRQAKQTQEGHAIFLK